MKGEEEEAKFSHKSRTGFICKETHRSHRRRRRLLRCERNGMLFYIEEGSEWHSSHNNKKSKAANKTELWNSFCMWMCLLLPSIHRIQNSSSNLIEILLKFQPFWWTYTKKNLKFYGKNSTLSLSHSSYCLDRRGVYKTFLLLRLPCSEFNIFSPLSFFISFYTHISYYAHTFIKKSTYKNSLFFHIGWRMECEANEWVSEWVREEEIDLSSLSRIVSVLTREIDRVVYT